MTAPTRVRLRPDARRRQLLDLGVRLLATHSLDELSIDLLAEEAGVSRGLLYHYFGGKSDFHEAVVRRATDELVEQTAPAPLRDPIERLVHSLDRYLGYVEGNQQCYLALVRGAASGNETLRAMYDETRSALTDRLFDDPADVEPFSLPDTPANRLVVRGWAALTEEMVLTWIAAPGDVSRERLLELVVDALVSLVELPVGPGLTDSAASWSSRRSRSSAT